MSKPYLVVRANVDDTMMEEFLAWYVAEHLRPPLASPVGFERGLVVGGAFSSLTAPEGGAINGLQDPGRE